jgi:NTE family protein
LSRPSRRLAAWLLPLALAACAAATYPNAPLPPGAANEEGRVYAAPPDRPAILMTFSGGGSRAAALAYFALQELRRWGDGELGRRLIDDVAFVSSVSGGSVTAAYLGLYGPDGLDGLRPDFLARDNTAELELTAKNPVTWYRLAFGGDTRIDVLSDLFDRQLFHGRTFAAMRAWPVVVLNATDMAAGEVFAFTAERFNDICSNLAALPISVGVAASAAFPVLLSPVDLENHAEGCPGRLPPAGWIGKDLASRYTRYLDVEEFKRARYANTLRRGPDAYRDVRYLHLLDGGLADNLGVHSLLDAVSSPHAGLRLLDAINSGRLRRLVVITVNARAEPPSPLDTQAKTPGVVKVVGAVVSNPIDAASAGVAAQRRALLAELRAAAAAAPPDARFGGVRVYDIEIDFDQLPPQEATLQRQVKEIPTLWTVTADELGKLDRAAQLLLHSHPCYQRLLADLGQPASFVDPGFAAQGCPQPEPPAAAPSVRAARR